MKTLSLGAIALATGLSSTAPAMAGPDPYLGDIMMVGETFCPRGWMDTSGQLLAISQFSALFSLMGTTYGGDGRTTFALPDLRSRVPVGMGQGPGLSNYRQGQQGGAEVNNASISTMANHTHGATSTAVSNLNATDTVADVHLPNGGRLATFGNANANVYASAGTFDQVMEAGSVTTSVTTTVASAGGNAITPNIQPFLGIRYCIATQGQFPSRN